MQLDAKEKRQLLNQHASRQWENYCRSLYPGAGRYWEGQIEIDLVAPQQEKKYLIGECKWAQLGPQEEKSALEDLKSRFSKTQLT